MLKSMEPSFSSIPDCCGAACAYNSVQSLRLPESILLKTRNSSLAALILK